MISKPSWAVLKHDLTRLVSFDSYELQVTPFLRGAGLGWVLMHALESIARGAAMQKCMLTVFLANSTALKFYKRIG